MSFRFFPYVFVLINNVKGTFFFSYAYVVINVKGYIPIVYNI